jgi:hypothetical protein
MQRVHFKPYHLQLLQKLSDNDKMKWKAFCEDTIKQFEVDEAFGDYHIFNDEGTFCLSGKADKKNVRM